MKTMKCALAVLAVILAVSCSAALSALAADEPAAATKPFKVEGLYLEACGCDLPCPCELIGLKHGCEGVGAVRLRGDSSYNGVSLAGCRIAYATVPTKWVRLYIDAKGEAQLAAAMEFAKAAFAKFGAIEEARAAKVEMGQKDGKYYLRVDGGKVINMTSEPVLGGDGKTALSYNNTKNFFTRTFRQARTINCTFKDGNRQFQHKDTNSYFNETMKNEGKL
jgi:hypothetical protein